MKPIKINKKALEKYSVSPYNFISLPEITVTRYKAIDELPTHNSFKDKNETTLLKGYLEYTLNAETPIIVADEKDGSSNLKFFKNTKGNYAIPGNTIRGMTRTNSQILSHSNISDEIEDSKFLYRDVAGNNALSGQYKKVLGITGLPPIAKNLKAGYMIKKGNDYFIHPSIDIKMEKPYFRIGEIRLRKMASNVKGIQYMYSKELIGKEDEIKRLNKKKKRSDKDRLVQRFHNKQHKPYQTEISFNYDIKGSITKIGNPGECSNNGYLLTGNHIYGKMSHYIVAEPDQNIEQIKVIELSIDAYINDMILTKKAENKAGDIKVKEEYEFYGLPKDGEKKPVFYIDLSGAFHFGFTPYLRVMYGKSILDGLPAKYDNPNGINYTDGLFGFSNKIDEKNNNHSYKSRLSFEDAEVIENGVIDSASAIDIILAEPKPTSFNLYLEQKLDSNNKNLNIYEDNFKIRGLKQYWLKEYIEEYDVKNQNMKSRIYPLIEGTKFSGKIYFENLNEDELGLLVWSLKLNQDCYQNIGLAKPYGFGRVRVEDFKLMLEDLDEKYSSFTFDYIKQEDENKFIDIYKKEFSNNYLNGRDIEDEKSVKELIKIKSNVVKSEDSNYYRYMEIQADYNDNGRKPNEFKDLKVLPEILNYEKALKSGKKNEKYIKNEKDKKEYKKDDKSKPKFKEDNSNNRNSFGNTMDFSNITINNNDKKK